jgi:glycosyltransferase involved in cell wall biosynthesis
VRFVNKRKILIFAHVPPPHHGQSVMVQVLLEGLRADPRFEVHHVDARVSDDLEDVGSFRPQKFWRLFKCIVEAWGIRLRHGRMAFYYVPAPGKRSAIMRDWVVMALCRPLFPELILHWHAYGLGEWVAAGNDWARKLTRWALGVADLSIVLNEYNKRDAEVFAPKRIEVVPNGIADQFADYETALAPRREARAEQLRKLASHASEAGRFLTEGNEVNEGGRGEGGGAARHNVILENIHVAAGLEGVRFLFLGHLMESKGVFVAIEATRMANEELGKRNAAWRAQLTLAGSFASEEEKARVLAAVEKAHAEGAEDAEGRRFLTKGNEVNEGGRGEGVESGERRAETGEGVAAATKLRRATWEGGAMVELVGFLDVGQKKSALEEADCLVFPTFYENEAQPLVLLEAMSAGLPVITTSWRGVPEVLPEGYPGVVAPRSAEELAAAMLEMPRGDRSQGLRQRYEERYTTMRHLEALAAALSSRAC